MEYPPLTISILTFKRPWYTLVTLYAILNNIKYPGPIQYMIADNGSPEWNLEMYKQVLKDYPHQILVEPSGSVSNLMNAAVAQSGDIWIMALDDFYPTCEMEMSEDVEFLMTHPEVGHLRYANMNGWDTPALHIYAELKVMHHQHYWCIDKSRSHPNSLWTMGFSMMHRRMWDAYGPIPYVEPHQPGKVENMLNSQFRNINGPTVAVPMRVWEQSGMKYPIHETINHIGHVRTDEYSSLWNQRWGAT